MAEPEAMFLRGELLLRNPGAASQWPDARNLVANDIAAIDAIATETTGTAFQRQVWGALREIPAGQTWSYSRLAAHIGRPTAVRAVGLANGANPIGVVVPCHRVIGRDGALTGYAGGLDRKRELLRREAAACVCA